MKEKTPYALLINDIHVSKDNIQEFAKNWEEALIVCEKNDINRIIVGGDMFQARSSQPLEVLMVVKRALIKAINEGIFVILAEGNHDKVNQEDLDGYNALFGEYPHTHVVDTWEAIPISGGVTLYIMSYFPENGSFMKHYNEIISVLEKKCVNILYCHEGIRGGLATPSEDELPADIFEPFDSVLVGHYHNRKKIKNTNIEYIGSSRQHNFGEDEKKGYTILYTDGHYEFVQNKANTRYKTILIDIEDVDEDCINNIANLKALGYKVKVQLSCSTERDSRDTKQQFVNLGVNKVEVIKDDAKISKKKQSSISQKFDKEGIKKEYSDFCAERNFNETTGLKYLNKINETCGD